MSEEATLVTEHDDQRFSLDPDVVISDEILDSMIGVPILEEHCALFRIIVSYVSLRKVFE